MSCTLYVLTVELKLRSDKVRHLVQSSVKVKCVARDRICRIQSAAYSITRSMRDAVGDDYILDRKLTNKETRGIRPTDV